MSENVLIIGSGALACLFAARLARSGQEITLTGTWQPALTAIRQKGIGLIENGAATYFPVATLDPNRAADRFQKAILLTKAYQTVNTLQRIKPFLSDTGSVLSLQNGLTPRSLMISTIGEHRSISGITLCAAEQIEPGVTRHNGGQAVFLGQHPDTPYYQHILTQAGFSVTIAADIQKMIWEKAIINSAANPLGAIMRYPNGIMYKLPEIMNIMDDLIREACLVAQADGCAVELTELQARMRQILKDTSTNRCSMLQDVLHGRETEIEDINGAILTLARQHGISTPVQQTITQLARSINKED